MNSESGNQLRVAVAQMRSNDAPEANADQVRQLLQSISNPQDVDLVAFPENSLFMKVDHNSPKNFGFSLKEPIFQELTEFAKTHDVNLFLGSVPYQEDGGISNATILVSPMEGVRPVYRKIHLFDVEVEGEKSLRESDQFVAGQDPVILDINGWRIGLSICYDLRFSELYLLYVKNEVDLIMVPSAFLMATGKAHWETLLRSRAIECQAYVVAAAQAGDSHGVGGGVRQSYGHSMVIDPWGKVLQSMEQEVGIIEESFSHDVIQKVRAQIPMKNHRKLL